VSARADKLEGGTNLLDVEGIDVSFGGIKALDNVSLNVPANAIVGLVGPNGAGKSTFFSVVSGLRRPDSGYVTLFGEDVTRSTPQVRCRMGLGRTFQQPELFVGLTVREHLSLAYRVRHSRSRLWKDMFTAGCLRAPAPSEGERVDQLIDLLHLQEVSSSQVAALPLGTTRLVEVGRALATSPSLVLLDEPLAGLDSQETERLGEALSRTVHEEKVSFLLVEHDVAMVMRLSQMIYVLDFGLIIAGGTPHQIRDNPDVRAAYLGDEDVAIARRDRHNTRRNEP
jgi:ABC-type branched-subunit amino acid transport system ATPase component